MAYYRASARPAEDKTETGAGPRVRNVFRNPTGGCLREPPLGAWQGARFPPLVFPDFPPGLAALSGWLANGGPRT